jgi:hypothetical protein
MILEMIRKMKTAYNDAHTSGEYANSLIMSAMAYSELCLELNQFDLVEIDGMWITIYHVNTYFVGIGGPK